jgi:CxxC motif-containing protein
MLEQGLICIGCPLGCHVTLKVSAKGEIETLTGNKCKEGKEYIIAEFQAPVRIFTATLQTEGGRSLLPVRTDKPVHKSQLKELMRALAKVRVDPPVKTGQVIIHNIFGTGANLVATGNL